MKIIMMLLLVFPMSNNLYAQFNNDKTDIKKQSFEFNAFNAFLGITDLKWVTPLNRKNESPKNFAVVGLYVDYAWGKNTRPINEYGKVKLIAAKLGWRYFFWKKVHLETALNAGYRHEEENIYDGTTLNAFSGRLYLHLGWQNNLKNNFYYRIAAGSGIHLFRLGDKYASTEKKIIPAIDISFGVKF